MQVTQQATDEVRRSREAIEAIDPSGGYPEREITFSGWLLPDGQTRVDRTYIQAELGMFPVQEFTTLVTEVIDSFTEGEMGMKIGDLFRGDIQMPDNFDPSTVNDMVDENMALVKAFVKAVQMLPGFQKEIITLSLGVPRGERNWFKDCISEPPSRGGLRVDEGFDILIVFIKQNASLLKDTFLGKARELVDTFRLEVLGEETSSDSTSETETATSSVDQALSSSPGGTPSSTSSPATPASV